MKFYAEKDLAMCGLACVLCSNEACSGCKAKGCRKGCECSIYQCVITRNIDGCYECNDFPCGENMLRDVRIKAFNRYARLYGKQSLLNRLKINFDHGITYHRPNEEKGDYDLLANEDDILRLIRFGTHTPYHNCPTIETEHFIFRLVNKNDAADLIKCYSDPKAQELFNSVNCSSDFRFNTIDEMDEMINYWLIEYAQQAYVRFSIVDKSTKRAIGTIEMFGKIGQYKVDRGILRIDVESGYENKTSLFEIISMCVENFYLLFGVKEIATRAIPEAADRIEALTKNGFQYSDQNDRELNYIRSK
jgi:RimJ/RimL family protein N-acetyltransferase